MLLLFTPEEQLVYCDELGAELRALTVDHLATGPRAVPRLLEGPEPTLDGRARTEADPLS
jgi:hypothetical protein